MDRKESKGRALVLGAGGGIGGETARRLLRAGWEVRALSRRAGQEAGQEAGQKAGQKAARDVAIDWVQGDALDAAALAAAARGCAVIVHAVNPPGYRNWAGLALPMLENSIAAAEAGGALVALPGCVYNYGPDAFPLIGEQAPQHPATRKGAVRVKMEAALEAYAARGGRALVLRAGDFFGPRSGNNWFAQALVKPGRPVRTIANPGTLGVGHQWAYLPDVAEAMVALIERRARLPAFARFHMAGHWDADGTAMTQAIRRATAGQERQAKPVRFPWWLAHLAAPFNETMRELLEMRYLWRQALRLDNAALMAELGQEPHTPLDEAVRRTLEGIGCLPAPGRHGLQDLQAAPLQSSR